MLSSEVNELASRLGKNVRALRQARGLTQNQMAKLSGLPRATWANLETGTANPTLSVVHRVALSLSVPIEELTSSPPTAAKQYYRKELVERQRQGVVIRSLIPHRVPHIVIERMEFSPQARFVGTPHMAGTREYFTCESGRVEVVASGEQYLLEAGDVLVFRGDQRHAYRNRSDKPSVGYSVVMLRPAE